jgi:hypothetical protein
VFANFFSYTFIMERIFAETVNLIDHAPSKSITSISILVNLLLKNALTIAGVICLVLLILGGFSFIVSAGGDAKAKEKGKNTITSAVIGLVLIFAAYWIIQIIQIVTGIKILDSGL